MFYTKYHTVVSSGIVIYSEQLSVTALATTYMEINGTTPPKTKVFRVWKHMENLGWVASCHVFLGLGLGVWSSPSSGWIHPMGRRCLGTFGCDWGHLVWTPGKIWESGNEQISRVVLTGWGNLQSIAYIACIKKKTDEFPHQKSSNDPKGVNIRATKII